MTNYKLMKFKLSAYTWVIIALVLTMVVGFAVQRAAAFKAESENQKLVVIEGDYIEAPAPEVVMPEPVLGAVTSPLLPGPDFGIGDHMQFSVSADFIDASTTIFAATSPFRQATTTNSQVVVETLAAGYGLTVPTTSVDLMALDITGASGSAHSVFCGSAPNQYATTTGALSILETVATVTGTPYLENNITAANADGGYLTGTIDKIFLTPERPWLICKYHGALTSTANVTSTANQFTGKGMFRARRLR